MSSRYEDLDWAEHLSTRPAASRDEIADAVYRQSGLGQPVRRPAVPQHTDDPELLRQVQGLGLA